MDNNDNTENKEGWDSLPEHIRNDLFIQVCKELSIGKDHTRILIMVTHGFIELLVNALIDHHLKNSDKVTSDSRSYPHSTKLLILNELGILGDGEYITYDWLRKLRNKAAHQPIFKVSKSELSIFKDEKLKDPANFHNLCIHLIAVIWNQHHHIFGHKFAPGVMGGSH